MGLVDRVNTALAETRVIGGVPWQPWNDPWQRFDTGGPAHPSRSGAGGVDGALALQPVYSCVRFIAEGVGKTPVLQYRDTGSRKVKMPPGPFITSPSNYLRPFDWKVVGMTSVLLQGMGIALVTSRDGYQYPLSAEWLPKDQVTIVDSQPFNPLKTKYYYAGRPVAREDLFIIRGLSVPGRTEAISPLRAFQAYIESGHSALEYSNVEMDAISEVTDTLDPWLVRFEEAYFECLPRPQLAVFDRDARIRHDIRTRYDVYRVGRDIGVLNVDEVRELEDREPLPKPANDSDYDGKDYTPLQIQVAAARGLSRELGVGPEGAPPPQSVKTGGIPEPGAPPQPGQVKPMPGPVKQIPPPVPAVNGKGKPHG